MIKGKTNLIIQSKPEDEEERSKRELQIDCYFEVLGQAWPHNPTTQGKPQPTEHWLLRSLTEFVVIVLYWYCIVLYVCGYRWILLKVLLFVVRIHSSTCVESPALYIEIPTQVYWTVSHLEYEIIRTPTKDGPRCRTQDYNYLFTSELLQKKK